MDHGPEKAGDFARFLRTTDVKADRQLGEALISAVVAQAVQSAGQRPGVWQRMLKAAARGAAKTEEGTVGAFLFQAVVDRLLEEFHVISD